MLPGTGGLTRLVDKRKVRRDLADVFSTLAEGVKGKRAVEWGLVDEAVPRRRFDEPRRRSARRALRRRGAGRAAAPGVELAPLDGRSTARTGSTTSYVDAADRRRDADARS